jgi:hypothetical protein
LLVGLYRRGLLLRPYNCAYTRPGARRAKELILELGVLVDTLEELLRAIRERTLKVPHILKEVLAALALR